MLIHISLANSQFQQNADAYSRIQIPRKKHSFWSNWVAADYLNIMTPLVILQPLNGEQIIWLGLSNHRAHIRVRRSFQSTEVSRVIRKTDELITQQPNKLSSDSWPAEWNPLKASMAPVRNSSHFVMKHTCLLLQKGREFLQDNCEWWCLHLMPAHLAHTTFSKRFLSAVRNFRSSRELIAWNSTWLH